MNKLQRRLLTILANKDAPVSAAEIRVRCQLPQSVDVIESNLRSLNRIGRVHRELGDWVRSGYQSKAVREASARVKKEQVKMPKNNGESTGVLKPPPPWPEVKPSDVDRKLALVAELQKLDREEQPHRVEDGELKMMALDWFIKKSPGPVADLLQRVVDEDLRPYVAEGAST